MKKSRATINTEEKIKVLVNHPYFHKVCQERPDLVNELIHLKEYLEDKDYRDNMRQRIRKINKLKNEINLEKR